MIRITGHRFRLLLRHTVELAFGAAIMGAVLTLIIYGWHWSPGVTIAAAVGIPVAAHGVGALLGKTLRGEWLDRPEVSWDQEGLTYRSGSQRENIHISWPDYQGYRLTWEYPTRLKIRKPDGHPLKVDLFAFSGEDRALLFAELNSRSVALPNQRLEPSRRMIEE